MTLKQRFRGFLPVVLDLETGGFDAKSNAILEIAAVFVGFDEKDQALKVIDHWQQAVTPRPGSRIEEASLKITGIDPERPGLSEAAAMRELFALVRTQQKDAECSRSVMVAHNAAFDMGFVNAAIERHGLKRSPFHPFTFIDTASLAAVGVGHTVLREACERADIVFDNDQAHSALYDAMRTAELFCWMVNRWDERCGPALW